MSTFPQWSAHALLWEISYQQLIYWYELAIWKNYKIEPEGIGKEIFGSEDVKNEDYEKTHYYDEFKGWVKKHNV